MIQPAAPSLLAPPSSRSSPPPAGGGVAFALPIEEGDDVSLLAGSPAGGAEDRHGDAAPGKLLPTDAAPASALWTAETHAPVLPLPVALTDAAASAPPIPAPRSAKFALPFSAPSSLHPALTPSTIAEDSTLDPDQGSARPDDADRMPGSSALAQPASMAVALIANPGPATPQPLATSGSVAAGPILASGRPAVASSLPEPSPPRTRSNANPIAPTSTDPMSISPVVAASTGSTMVSASALATSSLTPLDARRLDRAAAPTGPVMAAPVFAAPASTIDPPMPSAIPSPPARASVDVPTTQPDQATTILPSPAAAERMMIAAPASTAAARPALSPLVAADAAMGPSLPPSTTNATATPVGRDRPGQPVTLVPPLPVRDRPLPPSSSGATPTPTLPAGWQWAPRSVAPPSTPMVTPPIVAVAAEPTPVPLPSVSTPLDQSVVPAQPSTQPPTPIPTDATIGAAVPAERRAEVPLVVPPSIPTASIAPPATSAPAAIVFGAARFAAQVAEDHDEPAAPLGIAPLATAQAIERVVGVAATTQAPLDMRQEHWPHAMIERIEMIRDAVDAIDTRIRLVPDALGAINVEVKRDGDTLNVRFHAEQAQTRTLLADAAPRLAEAAEARGLRLGQNSVGADAGSPGQGQQRQPLPAAPPRAPRSPVADAHADDDDTRLA